MRFNTAWRVRISKSSYVKKKEESTIVLFFSRKYEENDSPYSWEHFGITHFVNSFLIVSSVNISFSLEDRIVKLSEHDPASDLKLFHIYQAPLLTVEGSS